MSSRESEVFEEIRLSSEIDDNDEESSGLDDNDSHFSLDNIKSTNKKAVKTRRRAYKNRKNSCVSNKSKVSISISKCGRQSKNSVYNADDQSNNQNFSNLSICSAQLPPGFHNLPTLNSVAKTLPTDLAASCSMADPNNISRQVSTISRKASDTQIRRLQNLDKRLSNLSMKLEKSESKDQYDQKINTKPKNQRESHIIRMKTMKQGKIADKNKKNNSAAEKLAVRFFVICLLISLIPVTINSLTENTTIKILTIFIVCLRCISLLIMICIILIYWKKIEPVLDKLLEKPRELGKTVSLASIARSVAKSFIREVPAKQKNQKHNNHASVSNTSIVSTLSQNRRVTKIANKKNQQTKNPIKYNTLTGQIKPLEQSKSSTSARSRTSIYSRSKCGASRSQYKNTGRTTKSRL